MPSFAYYNNSVIKIGGYIPNFNNTKAPPTLQGIFDLQTTINTTNTTGYLQALNPQTGNLEWEINISGSSAMSSPVLVGNMVYFGANSDSSQPNKNSGKVMAINLDTHQIVWTTYFPSGADRATQDTTLSIWNNTLVDGYAYTYNSSGGPQNRVISLTLVGINITNGNIKWKFNEPLGKNTPRSVLPPTTAYNGIVLSDTTEIGWLYALNIQTGNLLWKFYTGPELPNPQIIDGYVFAENQTGTVFVLELNGTLYESFNLGTPEDWCGSAQIVQIGNSIVFGGENGQLFSMPISEIINSSD
jgi:outer membrane protein assembly factor BamB